MRPHASAALTRLERKARTTLRNLQAKQPELSLDAPQLIGVSGGRDSVTLLHFLLLQGYRKLIVCHLNHQLRGAESDGDARFARDLAEAHGLPYEEATVDIIAQATRTKASMETAGRDARRAFFEKAAARQGSHNVFLAHHADDDVETILHHLFRGSGLRGIRGMDSISRSPGGLLITRPFLEITREDIDTYITTHGLTFREDSTNAGSSLGAPTRNRIRHRVLPFLKEMFQREVAGTLQRFARLAGRDEDYLQSATSSFLKEHQLLQSDRSLTVTTALKTAHPALQSRILRWWLREVHAVPNIGNAEIESALELLTSPRVARVNLPSQLRLRRKAGRLFLEKA